MQLFHNVVLAQVQPNNLQNLLHDLHKVFKVMLCGDLGCGHAGTPHLLVARAYAQARS